MNSRRFKTITLAVLLIGVGLAAFRLSFDAQVTLAIAAGVTPDLAALYPLIVDAAIVAGILMRLWNPGLTKQLGGYLWAAIAFWTITSVLGNAFHVLVLPADRVQLPALAAIAVNTLPALTLFLVIHLATTTAFRMPAATAPAPARKKPAARTSSPISVVAPAPQLKYFDEDPRALLALADEGLSMSQIAIRVGRSKSYVGARIKKLREERDGIPA